MGLLQGGRKPPLQEDSTWSAKRKRLIMILRYVLRRCIFLVFVIVGVTGLLFLITYSIPADPARVAAGPGATPKQVENLRQKLGLDRPAYVQYLTYMKNLFRLWPRERVVTGWFADAAETATKCVQCGECEKKCPYNLPIRELIQENYDFFKIQVGRGR